MYYMVELYDDNIGSHINLYFRSLEDALLAVNTLLNTATNIDKPAIWAPDGKRVDY